MGLTPGEGSMLVCYTFFFFFLPFPFRTWIEEMGGSSRGPGAHPIHLWSPCFAFSDNHLGNLGPHSGPALVRTKEKRMQRHSNLFPLWVFYFFSVSLLPPLVHLVFLYALTFFFFFSSPTLFSTFLSPPIWYSPQYPQASHS